MPKKDKLLDLKSQLNKELNKENSDNNVILSLSNQIAELDDTQIRFSIDAGIIDRLGKELVARQETAVSELVKNSYDADAHSASLTFINSDNVGGTLRIEDDGEGMDRDELINGFMRISSTDKIHNPYSGKYKRKRAGQKGIGRFSVQRLGSLLTIVTQKENSENAIKLSIEWDKYKNDSNLYAISNKIEVIEKIKIKGTSLIISGLRDRWTNAAIKRIYKYVADVFQPYPLTISQGNQNDQRIIETKDPGFSTIFYKSDGGNKKIITDDTVSITEHALATIEGYITDIGLGIYSVDSKKLDIEFIGEIGVNPDSNLEPFDKLKNVKFRAYYFIYKDGLIPKMQEASIQSLAASRGGIRLYRNGFRVLPYGEVGDDWLKLDKSLRQRSILPSHGNNNFFGFVELTDNEGIFNETSSREGLMENEAFIQLQNFIYRTLISGVLKVAESRNIKITTNQRKDDEGNWEKIELSIKNIAHTLDELDFELDGEKASIETKKRRKKQVAKIKQDIQKLEILEKNEQEKSIKEKSMLRVLSSVGLTIGQFIHEIKYYMDNIQSDVRFLISKLQNDKILLERITILDNNFSSFHAYTSYFDNVISQNIIRELKPIDLITIVKPFLKSISNDANKANINFLEPVYNQFRLFTKPMHPSEWSSILFNFYTNSKKAIKREGGDGKIQIECGESENFVYLEFSDNGDGITKENEDKIFDEFFTTTSPRDFDTTNVNNEITGTGLGLKIVKDIVSSYKGKIAVVSPKGSFSTCMRIEIPKATDKELDKYGL